MVQEKTLALQPAVKNTTPGLYSKRRFLRHHITSNDVISDVFNCHGVSGAEDIFWNSISAISPD